MTEPRTEKSTGIGLIATERRRQVDDEDWSPEHDDGHAFDEIALAAASYALPNESCREMIEGHPRWWPWDAEDWKPTPDDRVRELVKAGALIAAEIDRLQRSDPLTIEQGEGGDTDS